MKRINDIGWMVLAVLSTLVGLWVMIAEGFRDSKFYVYFIFTLLCIGVISFRRRENSSAAEKRKKRR